MYLRRCIIVQDSALLQVVTLFVFVALVSPATRLDPASWSTMMLHCYFFCHILHLGMKYANFILHIH
jgi:hypothetical protein